MNEESPDTTGGKYLKSNAGNSPSLIDAVTSVQQGLDLIAAGFVEEGIQSFEDCENAIKNAPALEDRELCRLQAHILLWVMLQRASIFSEIALLEEAAVILQSVLDVVATNNIDRVISGCFCQEYIAATIELSQVRASQGKLSNAVELLVDMFGQFPDFHFSSDQLIIETTTALVNMWGNYLGYDDLERRLLDSQGQERLLGNQLDDNTHWSFPFPLRGREYSRQREMAHNKIRELDDAASLDSSIQYQITDALCSVLSQWTESCPYSVVAKETLTRFLCAKAELEIELSLNEPFDSTMVEINGALDELLNEYAESIFLRIKSARWLSSLSRTILFHSYESEELFQHYYWFGANCITTAQSVVGSIRKNAPVTQATALRECMVTNLAALFKDMISKDMDALSLRSFRDRILVEVISRDQANDLAHRIRADFRPTEAPIDPEVALEVHNWNWSIVPLV